VAVRVVGLDNVVLAYSTDGLLEMGLLDRRYVHVVVLEEVE
jgi:hypothetical protein